MQPRIASLGLVLALAALGVAQDDSRSKRVRAAGSVTVELYVGREGVGLHAQRWSQAFARAGVPVTIRTERFGDEPEVTGSRAAIAYDIRVVGKLDSRGRLIFPTRSYSQSEEKKLFLWLSDLRAFGPQGNPDGEPLWGLSETQFGVLHTALSEPVAVDLRGKALADALKEFGLPRNYEVAWTPQARQSLPDAGQSLVTQSVEGVSRGTALAAVLNEAGLAYRPRRREDGQIELSLVPLANSRNVWPVGWPLNKPLLQTVPTLFDMTQIALTKIELDAVLEAAGEKVKLPVLTDAWGLSAQKIDLSTVKVSHPARRTAWISALKELTFQARARMEIWNDEAGKPFLWILPNNAPRRPNSDAPLAAPGKTVTK